MLLGMNMEQYDKSRDTTCHYIVVKQHLADEPVANVKLRCRE